VDGATLDVFHGQSALDVQDVCVFVNSKSFGDPNLGYISIHSSQATLYHNGELTGNFPRGFFWIKV